MEINQQVAQGDILFTKLATLPGDVSESTIHKMTDDNIIIAHSESGHHHVIERKKANVYTPKTGADLIAYILVNKDTVSRHLKTGPDRHADISLPVGVYKVTRGREYTPEGYRPQQD